IRFGSFQGAPPRDLVLLRNTTFSITFRSRAETRSWPYASTIWSPRAKRAEEEVFAETNHGILTAISSRTWRLRTGDPTCRLYLRAPRYLFPRCSAGPAQLSRSVGALRGCTGRSKGQYHGASGSDRVASSSGRTGGPRLPFFPTERPHRPATPAPAAYPKARHQWEPDPESCGSLWNSCIASVNTPIPVSAAQNLSRTQKQMSGPVVVHGHFRDKCSFPACMGDYQKIAGGELRSRQQEMRGLVEALVWFVRHRPRLGHEDTGSERSQHRRTGGQRHRMRQDAPGGPHEARRRQDQGRRQRAHHVAVGSIANQAMVGPNAKQEGKRPGEGEVCVIPPQPDEKPGHAEYAEQTQAPSQCGPKHPNISQRGACDYQCGNRLATHRTLDQPVRKRRPRSAEYQNDGRGIVKPPRAQQMPTPGEQNGQDRQQHQGYSIGFRGHAQRREHPENNRRPGALAF